MPVYHRPSQGTIPLVATLLVLLLACEDTLAQRGAEAEGVEEAAGALISIHFKETSSPTSPLAPTTWSRGTRRRFAGFPSR